MSLGMGGVGSATLLVDFRISSGWRRRLWQRCVSHYISLPEFQFIVLMSHADGILSFATISLALKVPRMADPRMQQIAVFIWGGVMLGMYSFLLSVFRVKNGGYPFWLPPF